MGKLSAAQTQLLEIAEAVSRKGRAHLHARDSEFVGREDSVNLRREKLIKMLVGRTIDQFFQKEHAAFGAPVLKVERLTRHGYFRNISFSARDGEISGTEERATCKYWHPSFSTLI